MQLLQELLSSKKEATQESAKRILRTLGQNLHKQTIKILSTNGWHILHFPENPPQHLIKLEPALLKEAIALRKGKQEKLSLAILDLSIKSGLKTDRIDDNRARALVNDEQYFEAVTIWNALKESKNVQIQQSAISMLKVLETKDFNKKFYKKLMIFFSTKKTKAKPLISSQRPFFKTQATINSMRSLAKWPY